MGLPDDVDLMIEAKGSSDLSFLPHVSRLLLPDLSCLSVYLLTASHFFPFLNRIDKEQAVLHLYNVYDLFPVHRGSYVPPKPPAEPSATIDEDDPEAPLPRDKDGNPIELTPMAKAKRAKAKAKVVAGRKREAREEKKRLEAVADGEVLEEERVDADKIAPVKKGKGKGKGKAAAAGVKSETDGDEEVVPPAPKKQSTPAKRAKAEREEGEGAKKPAVKKPRVTKKAAATAAKEKAQEGAVSGFGDGADSDLSEMEE
jgi:hypothetical protein